MALKTKEYPNINEILDIKVFLKNILPHFTAEFASPLPLIPIKYSLEEKEDYFIVKYSKEKEIISVFKYAYSIIIHYQKYSEYNNKIEELEIKLYNLGYYNVISVMYKDISGSITKNRYYKKENLFSVDRLYQFISDIFCLVILETKSRFWKITYLLNNLMQATTTKDYLEDNLKKEFNNIETTN